MRDADLDRVLQIETVSFASPWRRRHFEYELHTNPYARNHVALAGERVAGYVCVWSIADELRINNLAVAPDYRRRGLGGWLLERILEVAAESGCREASLEVRPSNVSALALYERHGFRRVGLRKGYYALEQEDAVVMAREIGPENGRATPRPDDGV